MLKTSGPQSNAEQTPPAGRCLVTTSWDDGHSADGRLADLLASLGVPATFYVSREGKNRQVSDAFLRDIASTFEVGAHSLTHPALTQVGDEQLTHEVAGSRAYIEAITGSECTMFCYPSSDVDERVALAVRNAGFEGARTNRSLCDGRVDDPFMLHTTIQVCTHTPSLIRVYSPARYPNSLTLKLDSVPVDAQNRYDWAALARLAFDTIHATGGVWHLWGHSWEVDACGLWEALEDVLRYVTAHADVALCTNGQLVRYAMSYVGHDRVL
ncbi:MAG TPA: polysaccharide deacetylase family protein [Chloroflexia bacterium]|nr:polysaccharide deacetylase family protein [Chloroflexia bacterium]